MTDEKQTIFDDMISQPKLAPAYLPTNDPRPDLAADSKYWGRLLSLAHGFYGEEDPESLFWLLQMLRCMGTMLQKSKTGWGLIKGQNQDYARDREKYLVPKREQVMMLLEKLNAL